MSDIKKFMLKFVVFIAVLLFAIPLILKLLGFIRDAAFYVFNLYVSYIDLYFNDDVFSLGVASTTLVILIFLIIIIVAISCAVFLDDRY
ncbi:hypothetical protein [Acinetobacter haemolyticus]|uniref:hypothetical protein n=1 Tax=Acinetobacter haemolyticus TaxID=29430 RepID=UPI0021CD2D02|nr:hypothetical protein [Acinetobacter haemolyticus]MCU4380023.1 hypothetical protein [Acinetobacter haemolyticus]